jgi:hypothetical protein
MTEQKKEIKQSFLGWVRLTHLLARGNIGCTACLSPIFGAGMLPADMLLGDYLDTYSMNFQVGRDLTE